MKKFLKAKPSDGPSSNEDALNALSAPVSPGLKKSSTSRWKKNKKQPEMKPQLDLQTVLPSTDDFRTSLIMPSLSTRFSMLREQDDPHSLLGKASDDSVLQPRRRSRMMDFGFAPTGLSDIAEVSSIHDSFRPPFAEGGRGHSFLSEEGYSSDADLTPSSVMSRSRPGEGNNLFGGRQKIYKIPTSGANSTRSLGKLVYEDDIGMSAFQRYRQRERELDESQLPRASDESQNFDFGLEQAEPGSQECNGLDTLPNDSAKDLSHSPSLSSYDKKRSTTSSTARSDARSSTAATSVASQPSNSAHPSPAQAPATTATTILRANTPDQGPMSAPLLDRSNAKTRRLYDQGLDQHMHEQQASALTRLNSIQRQRGLTGKKSPPLLHGARSVGNLQDRSHHQPVYALNNRPSPSPSPLPHLNTLGSVKNAHSDTSSPVISGPQSPVDMEDNEVWNQSLEPGDRGKATAMGAFNKPAQAFDEKQYLERQRALQRSNSNAVTMKKKTGPQAAAQAEDRRQQSSPDLTDRARSGSVSQNHEATRAYNVFQNAVNQFPTKAPAPATQKAPLPDTHRTFFGNISASEDEDDDDDSHFNHNYNQHDFGHGNFNSRWQPTQLQPVSEHPALRSQRSMASVREEREEQTSHAMRHATSSRSLRNDSANETLDSPTIPGQGQALNGMMHHLRQKSNQSSIYPNDEVELNEDVPEVPDMPWSRSKMDSFGHVMGSALDDQSAHDSTYAVSNPWDLDEQSYLGHTRISRDSVSPVDEAPSANIPSSRQSEVSVAQDESNRLRPAMSRQDSEASTQQGGDWQQELRKQHAREASTATQQERDAFANELAARRNAIKENIKSIVERDTHSRGTSPAPSSSGPLKGALGMLRSKASRESVVNMQDQPPKAMKVLGTANGHDMEGSARPPLPTAQHPAFKPDGPGPSRDMDTVHAERFLNSSRSRAPSSGRNRSRSNSTTTTGRSRSRTGPYRDDLEKAMVEGYGSSAAAHTPDMSPFPGASPDVGRRSDEDKNAFSSYFDQMTGRFGSNGASPVTLAPNAYNPVRPVPVANPYSQNATPPLSGSSPVVGTQPYVPIVPSSTRPGGMLRKKTISKHDISEPTLISSTSNVDTVDLPEGASLKNGIEDPPPIPPINPRRRTTRKIFGRDRSNSRPSGDYEIRATASDPMLNAYPSPAPSGDFHFPSSSTVRLPKVSPTRDYDAKSPVQQYGTGSPERAPAGPQRSVTAPLDGSMF